MRIVKILKRKGSYRTIYIPSRREKVVLDQLLPDIRAKAQEHCHPSVVHGFLPGHSPVTNAEAHIGWRYTLSFDLADFFDHITVDLLERADPNILTRNRHLLMPDNSARQGLPTSPFLANIAGSLLDQEIISHLLDADMCVTYTRYADDLAFSYDESHCTETLRWLIPEICLQNGLPVNPTKTRLHSAANGRRILCGVAVGDYGLFPTRSSKRKLRAALHQKNTDRAAGLSEWMRLKAPRQRYVQREVSPQARSTRRHIPLSVRSTPLPRQYTFNDPI